MILRDIYITTYKTNTASYILWESRHAHMVFALWKNNRYIKSFVCIHFLSEQENKTASSYYSQEKKVRVYIYIEANTKSPPKDTGGNNITNEETWTGGESPWGLWVFNETARAGVKLTSESSLWRALIEFLLSIHDSPLIIPRGSRGERIYSSVAAASSRKRETQNWALAT